MLDTKTKSITKKIAEDYGLTAGESFQLDSIVELAGEDIDFCQSMLDQIGIEVDLFDYVEEQ